MRGLADPWSADHDSCSRTQPVSAGFQPKAVPYSASKMTIRTKSMMRRRVNLARPSGLV